jgi:hypothetical protein
MALYTEILGINTRAAENLAAVHYGYAASLHDLNDKRQNSYAASSFLIAGILRSITDPKLASDPFRRSANLYRRNGNPFWKIAAVCGQDTEQFNTSNKEENIKNLSPEGLFYEILSRQFLYADNRELLWALRNSRASAITVGRLGLPLGIYIEAFLEMEELSAGSEVAGTGLPYITGLLNRSSERIRLLQSDPYHWRNLMGTVIPLEPEILAASTCLCVSAVRKKIRPAVVMEYLRTYPVSTLPMLVAGDMLPPEGRKKGGAGGLRGSA